MLAEPLGIYVHIPFCLRKCSYCAFISQAGHEELQDSYVTALCREIAGRGGLPASVPVDTVFFGGGTPTVLSPESLGHILCTIRRSFEVLPEAEVSLEANPGTVTAEGLAVLRQAGFNRISIGVQSFDNDVLRRIGRVHNSRDAFEAVAMARSAGFKNISLDLMYGLPGQSIASWKESLEEAVLIGVSHISAYGLKVEPGTPLAADVESGQAMLPEESDEEAMYDWLVDFLPRKSLQRYEISNFAKTGAESRHNLRYWRYRPYLGFGVAAHSFFGGERRSNSENLDDYLRKMSQGESPVDFSERPDMLTQMAEFMFLGLRTTAGVEAANFADRFDTKYDAVYGGVTEKLLRQGLLTYDGNAVRLTERGMKLGNQVFVEFLPA